MARRRRTSVRWPSTQSCCCCGTMARRSSVRAGGARVARDGLQCSPVGTGAHLAARSPLPAHVGLSAAGAKLEDSEVRSVASNQSEMEFSSLQDMVRPWFGPPHPPSDTDAQQGLRH